VLEGRFQLEDPVACICGLGETTETCCGPIIAGKAAAPTAERLMRARYTAYVEAAIDYLHDSIHPSHRADFDRAATLSWSKSATWHGLEILATEGGGENDEKGVVEFRARFSVKGMAQEHHERAEFEKEGGKWYFVDGKIVNQKPVTREGPRVGRNDPCPCGSGKKYKKCCGKAA
jgi:SEC-C motif-containing protein